MGGVGDAQHLITHTADDVLVGAKAGQHHLGVFVQTSGHKLLDEVDAHASGQEEVKHIGLGRANFSQLGRVVQLAQLGIDLSGHLAFVETLETRQGVFARLVVGGDQISRLEAPVGRVLACGLMVGVVGPRHRKEIRAAVFASDGRWCGVGAEVKSFFTHSFGQTRQHDVGEHHTGHEVHFVALDIALKQLLAHIGLELVVANQHLGRQTTKPAAVELDRQVEGIANLCAQCAIGTRQGADEPDLDLVSGLNHGSGQQAGQRQGQQTA